MEQRQYINREYKTLFGVWGGGRRGTKTVNVPFLIRQRAHKVPFLTIQRALEVPFFIKLPCPFLFLGYTLITEDICSHGNYRRNLFSW